MADDLDLGQPAIALPDPLPDPAAPPPLVVDPDPLNWTLIEAMEVRREFGYSGADWSDAVKDSPELLQIGSAWLALRRVEPGITWKEAAERMTMREFARPVTDGPKATPRAERRRSR